MTMGYRAPSKKAIKDQIKLAANEWDITYEDRKYLDFRANVQETSFFGPEARIPGENIVVGPDAERNRKWYATLTVDEHGMVVGIR